jgi:putative transposase
MFKSDKDFIAFEKVIAEAIERHPTRILSYCLMGNHWHFVVWPRKDGELSAFFKWLGHTHAMRWRVAHGSVGMGPVYQGRFKSFPIQRDAGLETVLRYVERNALSAGLVKRAEAWRWSSLWVREHGTPEQKAMLTEWPIKRPSNWVAHVNEPLSDRELDRLRVSIERDRPFGTDAWVAKTVTRLGLEHTVRSEGRPRKVAKSRAAER